MLQSLFQNLSKLTSKIVPQPIQNIFKTIFDFGNKSLNLIWKIGVPALLVALLVVPIFLSLFPSAKKSSSPTTASIVAKADVIKKISVQGTTQYSQQYDLPVYQDSVLNEILVKQGDSVTAGQVLAKLDFVNENKLRSTATQNAINQSQQDIANSQKALGDMSKINQANYGQMDTSLKNRKTELEEISKNRIDKKDELNTKKSKYVTEMSALQKKYDDLNNFGNVTDSITSYQSQIDSYQNQIDNNQKGSTSYYQNQINDLNNKIQILQKTQYFNDGGMVSYNQTVEGGMVTIRQNKPVQKSSIIIFNTGNSPAIADTNKTANITKQKADIQADINDRKNWIKQIDDNVEVKNYDDQILAKQKIIDELLATQNLTKANLDQNISGNNQKIASTQTSIEGAKKILNDTLEDIAKQEKNRTITAKTDGIIGRVYKDQGLAANAKEVVFSVTSSSHEIAFSVSADNRAIIKQGMKVNTDKYKGVDGITVTDTPAVPDSTSTTSTPAYTIKAKLPKTDKYQYTAGETVSVEVVISEQPQVTTIPSSGVVGGKVFVGVNPILPEPKNKDSGFSLPFNIGRNGTPIINGVPGGNGGGRGGNRNGNNSGSNNQNNTNNPSPSSQTNKRNNTDLTGIKFLEIKEIAVTTGLDDGQNVEIKDGLKEGDYIVTIFPKTQKDQDLAKTDLVK